MFEDDSSREEVIQDLCIDEESQEDVYEPRPLEISIVEPPTIKCDHVCEDPIWSAPPPTSLTPFILAQQTPALEPSRVEHTCRLHPYLAKLEGVQNQDPFDMLYDTYYGRTPLFDELPWHQNN